MSTFLSVKSYKKLMGTLGGFTRFFGLFFFWGGSFDCF